jgi:hypothetical protein
MPLSGRRAEELPAPYIPILKQGKAEYAKLQLKSCFHTQAAAAKIRLSRRLLCLHPNLRPPLFRRPGNRRSSSSRQHSLLDAN